MKKQIMHMRISEIIKHIEVIKHMDSAGVKLNKEIKDYFYTLVEVRNEFSIEKTVVRALTQTD